MCCFYGRLQRKILYLLKFLAVIGHQNINKFTFISYFRVKLHVLNKGTLNQIFEHK